MKKNSGLLERVDLIIKRYGSRDRFCEAMGLKYGTVSSWYSQQRDPKIESLEKIALRAGVNIRWLRYGEGFPDMDGGLAPIEADGYRVIPVVGLVHAGELIEANDGEFPAGHGGETVFTCARGQQLFGCRVEGDSMTPDFRDGDIIIVNPEIVPVPGEFAVVKIAHTGEVAFRKIAAMSGAQLVLRPLNPDYPDLILKDTEVKLIGKIVRLDRSY
jgi:phage repressor protein C with HTH and peptisase S24 domain